MRVEKPFKSFGEEQFESKGEFVNVVTGNPFPLYSGDLWNEIHIPRAYSSN